MKTIKSLIPALSAVLFLASCATPANIPYFQDAENESVDTISVAKTIRIRPGDKISIIVNCSNPEIAFLFNLSYATRYVGTVSDAQVNASTTGVQGYMVSEDGTIDFPELGPVYVEGKTREEIASIIKNRLVDEGLVQNPVVTVEYLNLKVSVLGEVARPGRVSIDRDEFTLLDALSSAGDLTIYGVRENVRVVRTENGMSRTYTVNLLSSHDVFSSPVYYLQQNDMIYVEPNDVRARQSTVNGNNIRSTSFWISLASLLTSMTSTLVLLFR